MKVLLIGNRGSFFELCREALEKSYVVDSFCIDKNRAFNLPLKLDEFKSTTNFESYSAIIYISGETRDEDYMHLLNFRFPSELADISSRHEITLIYLSSLAVFAGGFEDVVTSESQLMPIDNYGHTKALMDQYVLKLKRESSKVKIKILFPASFYHGSGRSLIERYEQFSNRHHLFFKLFGFSGCLSYVDREKLIDFISKSIVSDDYGSRILSSHFELDQQHAKFILPMLPIWFFKLINKVSPMLSIKLRMVLRGIRYG
jgi:hypothetical protein